MDKNIGCVLLLSKVFRKASFHQKYCYELDNRQTNQSYECPFKSEESILIVIWWNWYVTLVIPSVQLFPQDCLFQPKKTDFVFRADFFCNQLQLQVRGIYRGQTLHVRGMYRVQTLQV